MKRISIALAAISATLAVVAHAAGPFNDQPAGPQSLPGDLLPPFAMLDAEGKLPPVPPLPEGGVHGAPETTAAGPNLDEATALARAALDACAAEGLPVGVAVIDSAGEARAMLTADGSDGSHVFVAMRKALVAREFGVPNMQAAAMIEADPALLARVTPAMFVVGGAVPILRDGEVIGALGVSGAKGTVIGQQDEACAVAGLAAIMRDINA